MPQNCETSFKPMDTSYPMESRDLNSSILTSETNIMNDNCKNVVHNSIDPSSNPHNEMITDNCSFYDDTKFTRQDYVNKQGKFSLDVQQLNLDNHLPVIETSRSIIINNNHSIPCKRAKLIGCDSSIITDPIETIKDKPLNYLMIGSNRKVDHHHSHPMAPVDFNRVNKLSNSKSSTFGTINSSIYPYINESKLENLIDNLMVDHHSTVNHSLSKTFPGSIHSNQPSSSGQENHSPKSTSTMETITPLKPTLTNLSLMAHQRSNNYRNDYLKPSISSSSLNRMDNVISPTSEIQTMNKLICESITMIDNSHTQGTIEKSSIISFSSVSSSSSSSSSSCSSVDKILPMINVVSLNNETETTTTSTSTTSSSYNKETIPTMSDQAMMNISDFVSDYSDSHYSNASSQDQLSSISSHQSLSADLRRTRYRETWDFLNESDLIEVTLKTADLMKRNQLLQRDIERLREEVSRMIPATRICEENNQIRVNNVCIENSA